MLIINPVFSAVFNQVIPDVNWNPLSIFTNSEQGAWYDPSDITTLFQDSLGVTPVTAVGQTVGRILDKSGRGNHATQVTLTKRPTYQIDSSGFPYLLFDGVDDNLVSATIVPGTDKVQLLGGIRKLSDALRAMFVEYTPTPITNSFTLWAPNSSASEYSWVSRGTLTATIPTATTYKAPISNVLFGIADVSAPSSFLRINGGPVGSSYVTQGTGNYTTNALYIGSRGGLTNFFNGRCYGIVLRFGPNLTSSQIASAETWMNAKTGAY